MGKSSRNSLAKVASRLDGLRDVVISGRGSRRPDVVLYSSSRSASASGSVSLVLEVVLVSVLEAEALVPCASEARCRARRAAVSAVRRVRALR